LLSREAPHAELPQDMLPVPGSILAAPALACDAHQVAYDGYDFPHAYYGHKSDCYKGAYYERRVRVNPFLLLASQLYTG
jgi:hypothetical protein